MIIAQCTVVVQFLDLRVDSSLRLHPFVGALRGLRHDHRNAFKHLSLYMEKEAFQTLGFKIMNSYLHFITRHSQQEFARYSHHDSRLAAEIQFTNLLKDGLCWRAFLCFVHTQLVPKTQHLYLFLPLFTFCTFFPLWATDRLKSARHLIAKTRQNKK